jgi:hypothetical protein
MAKPEPKRQYLILAAFFKGHQISLEALADKRASECVFSDDPSLEGSNYSVPVSKRGLSRWLYGRTTLKDLR